MLAQAKIWEGEPTFQSACSKHLFKDACPRFGLQNVAKCESPHRLSFSRVLHREMQDHAWLEHKLLFNK